MSNPSCEIDPRSRLSPLLVGEVLDRMRVLPGTVDDFGEEALAIACELGCLPTILNPLKVRLSAAAEVLADHEVGGWLADYRFGSRETRFKLTTALARLIASSHVNENMAFDAHEFVERLRQALEGNRSENHAATSIT